jgi:hypothetical protein
MRAKKIITNNSEIYNKLNSLHFTNNIIIKNVKSKQINKIIKNINKHEKIISSEKTVDGFKLKKLKPIKLDIYLKKI